METSKKIIVAFHKGRGGKYHNAGHLTFIGEKNFQDLILMNSENIFEKNRDENGKFCNPYLTDWSGNNITDDDIRGEVGTLDFDGQYDTDIAKYIEDCADWELEKIATSDQYRSPKLLEWLSNYNSDWKFDKYGMLEEVEEVED